MNSNQESHQVDRYQWTKGCIVSLYKS